MTTKITSTQAIIGSVFCMALLLSYASNPPDGHTGAPGDSLCSACHSPANPAYAGTVTINGVPSTIQPNTDYNVTVTVTKTAGNGVKAGFQWVALNESNQNAGTVVNTGPATGTDFFNGRTYVDHRPAQNFIGNTVNYTFTWRSPLGPAGSEVTMYAVGNIANGNNAESNDRIVTTSQSYTIAGGGSPLVVNIINPTDVSCFGGNNGTATAIVGGGTPPYSYIWTSGSTAMTATNLSAGVQSVTVTDQVGSMGNGSVTIGQPTPMNALILNQTTVTCQNQTASATVSVSGGSPGYTYFWTSGETSNTAINLNAGQNFVTITDSHNCTLIQSVFIVQNTTPPIANAGQNGTITCANPQLTLSGAGSSSGGNFQYTWSTLDGNIVAGANSLNPVVDAPGSYTLNVFNVSNGCESEDVVTVFENTVPPIADAGPSSFVNCSNPQAQLSGLGSSQGTIYTYLWTTVNGHIVSGANSLNPIVDEGGTYVLEVTNLTNGCKTTDFTIVTEDTTNPTANAGASMTLDCQITVVNLNGSGSSAGPNFTYNWTTGNGHIINGATTLNPLVDAAGAYSLQVTNISNGCSSTDVVFVTIDTLAPTADAGVDLLLTCHNPIDTLDGTNSSTGSNYVYIWATADGNFVSGDSTLRPVIDAPGRYFLTVIDLDNNCVTLDSVDVSQVGSPILSGLAMNVSCHGASDGSITVIGSGGLPPYAYFWSNGDTTNMLQNISAGIYTVILTDSVNCTDTMTFTIEQPPALIANAFATGETSNNSNDGTAHVVVSGGVPPYSIEWSNGATTDSIFNLNPGFYSVVVTDSINCTATDTVLVSRFNCDLSAETSSTEVTCFGGSDGTATINVLNGTAPYLYTWSNGGNTATISGLPAGSYSVTVVAADNCTATLSVSVVEPPLLNLEIDTVIHVKCHGDSTGSALATISGGTFPYTFVWPNNLNFLPAGTYDISVTDANGCADLATFTINQPDPLQLTIDKTDETSNGANDGTATAQISGGTPPYQYLWSTGSTDQSITDLAPGTYHLTATDANNCTVMDSVQILSFNCAGFSANVAGETFICPGTTSGSLSIIEISGGTAPFHILWSTGSSDSTIIDLGPGIYNLSITDASNCSFDMEFEVLEGDTVAPLIKTRTVLLALNEQGEGSVTAEQFDDGTTDNCKLASIEISKTTFTCADLGVQTLIFTATDSAGNVSTAPAIIVVEDKISPTIECPDNILSSNCVQVDFPAPVAADNCMIATLVQTTGPASGEQFPIGTTTVTFKTTDSSNNEAVCSFTVTVENTVDVDFLLLEDCSDTVVITPIVNGGSPPYTYMWEDGFIDPIRPVTQSGTYEFTATDTMGCQATESIDIEVIPIVDPPISVTVTNETDNLSNGGADVTILFGVGPYEYEWLDAAGNIISRLEDLVNVPAGDYLLIVYDSRGCEATQLVTIDRTVGLDNRELEAALRVFPSPANEKLTITLESIPNFPVTWGLYNLNGQVVMTPMPATEHDHRWELPTEAIPAGIYLLKVVVDNQVVVRKVGIQH